MTDQPVNVTLRGKRIAYVATVPWFLMTQLKSQIEYMRAVGLDVTLISSPCWKDLNYGFHSEVRFIPVEMRRALSPLKDLVALYKLYRIFRKNNYTIVHSTTPKAGLLTAIAAYSARISVRVHTFTGQPWVTMRGLMRRCARCADWLIGKMNTHCYADSKSQWSFLIGERVVTASAISVIGHGSLAGVELKRFNPDRWNLTDKTEIRRELSIDRNAKVIMFIGRLARDKGISELVSAFYEMLNMGYDVCLLLVGPVDERDAISNECMRCVKENPRICYVPSTEHPERYLAIADILCLPSYREGFGTSIIEAASMGVPAVGTKINGLIDAIVDGETGILVPPKDVQSLREALRKLIDSPKLLESFGIMARKRCVRLFDSNIVNANMSKEYVRMLNRIRR